LTVQRGDIYHVDLNPIKGREQAGPRFVCCLTLELRARGGRFIEKAPGFIIDEVLAKLATLIE